MLWNVETCVGVNCETNHNDCTPNPCQNGGQCIDGIEGYQCTCAVPYTGPNCSTMISPCQPSFCQNEGRCIPDAAHTGFTCNCSSGYTGELKALWSAYVFQSTQSCFWVDLLHNNVCEAFGRGAGKTLYSVAWYAYNVCMWSVLVLSFMKSLHWLFIFVKAQVVQRTWTSVPAGIRVAMEEPVRTHMAPSCAGVLLDMLGNCATWTQVIAYQVNAVPCHFLAGPDFGAVFSKYLLCRVCICCWICTKTHLIDRFWV